jgi:hypothetical protein
MKEIFSIKAAEPPMCTHPQIAVFIRDYAKNLIAWKPVRIGVGNEFFSIEITHSAPIGSHP